MRGRMPLRLAAMAALLLTLSITLAVNSSGARADGGDDQAPPIPEKRELKYPNLGSHLDQLVAQVEEGDSSAQDAAGEAPMHRGESVAVTIYLSGNVDGVVAFLEDNGGDPRNEGEDYIEAYVPVPLLGPVSEQPGVVRVREIVPPQPAQLAQQVIGNGPDVHGSPAWNQAGYSGQGVKVGVIDLGFKGISSLWGPEVPSRIVARCYTDVGVFTSNLSDCEQVPEVSSSWWPECVSAVQRRQPRGAQHGTIVAESVIDVAPEIELYIARPQSKGDTQAAADWMASQGVTVINHSVGWTFDGPGDGSSPLSVSPLNTVDRAVARGITWVNAAGNSAEETWFGSLLDPDNDGVINFSGNDDGNEWRLRACRSYRVQLRWDDDWDGASTDLDLYIVEEDTDVIILGSVDVQSGGSGQVPYETISFINRVDRDDWDIVVRHYGGEAPDWVQVMVWSIDPLEHHTLSGSITNPAESANAGMLAVGAAPWYDTDTIESFSSRGPTPDGRVKPDIVGADCGETALRPLNESRRGFCGTSQASPHVAGMAALVRQRFPDFSPEEVAGYLKDHAAERGAPGADNTWGHGFAVLPTIVFSDLNGDSAQLQNHIARYIVENGYGHLTGLASSSSSLALLLALRDGDSHVAMEVWLPEQIEAWEEALAAGEVLSPGASLGTDWQSAFVIPAYLQEQYPELDSVEDLKEQQYQALFATAETRGKARLVSCVIGWICEETNSEQIEGYGLSDHVDIFNPSSATALDDSLHDAYEKRDPWLGYQFRTSRPALLLDLVRLEEPEYSDECWGTTKACAYPESDILIGVNSSLPEWAPEVVEFLKQWDFNVDTHLRNVTRWQAANPDASIEDAAVHWLNNNVDTWGGWVTAEAATDVLDALGEGADEDVLVALYNATDGDNWTDNTNWLSEEPLGDWHGVTTDGGGRVTGLNLGRNQLAGTIPAKLGSLANLELLYLLRNELTGEIPVELGSLANLEVLELGDNQLSGTIPARLGGLTNLKELSLTRNHLSGEIPVELAGLTSLEILALGGNQLGGTIPTWLGSLVNLEGLYLWGNGLTGTIPAELGGLVNLTILELGTNQLSGTIPTELGGLVNLTILELGTNQLSGTIPTELGGLVNLEELGLDNNQLTGEIPAELGGLASLQALDLSVNGLTGEIPVELGQLANLAILELGRNQLSGEIPAELGSLASLEELSLHNNQLIGEIPAELVGLASLEGLYLGDNQLSGEIPAELGSLANLEQLQLQNNQLTGGIPAELGGLASLEVLDLWRNELTGEIPAELGRLTNLTVLFLSENQLTGEIPSELGRLTNLTVLYLAGNQLTGCIPYGWQDVDDSDLAQLGLSFCDPGDPLIARYDTNRNGVIDRSEVIAAINDYLFGEGEQTISRSDVIRLINLYLFG